MTSSLQHLFCKKKINQICTILLILNELDKNKSKDLNKIIFYVCFNRIIYNLQLFIFTVHFYYLLKECKALFNFFFVMDDKNYNTIIFQSVFLSHS